MIAFKRLNIFGIPFIVEGHNVAINLLRNGGLMVVPSGPGLATIGKDLRYTEAVQYADFAIPDSGYMVLLLKVLKGINIRKLSGYKFLKQFLHQEYLKGNKLFLVDPTEKESRLNNKYLNSIGVPIDYSCQYVAPIYENGEISDKILLDKLDGLIQKPKYIMINLGSGVQEPLGYYLKQNLNFKPGIICTGAAIAFITGTQVNMSPIIDKFHLGWLWRCIYNPRVFIPRYFMAFRLFRLILKEKVEIST